MNWTDLKSEADLNELVDLSAKVGLGCAIFKHSTRCSISSLVKSRLSSSWDFDDDFPIYYLDLLKHRDLSDLIAKKFDVIHESPQLLIIKDGSCVYHASHMSISVSDLRSVLKA